MRKNDETRRGGNFGWAPGSVALVEGKRRSLVNASALKAVACMESARHLAARRA